VIETVAMMNARKLLTDPEDANGKLEIIMENVNLQILDTGEFTSTITIMITPVAPIESSTMFIHLNLSRLEKAGAAPALLSRKYCIGCWIKLRWMVLVKLCRGNLTDVHF
jgi:hypothetical protein